MNSEQKSAILGAITLVKSRGYKIVYGGFGSRMSCCPIRALFIASGSTKDYVTEAANTLRCTESQIWGFIFGFDFQYYYRQTAYSTREDTKEFFKFGQELRAKEFGQ